ncbi:uncharacterized protein [Littorina saxatilis]|uniref:DUF4806 domain-containing protein n=1 Tax=Littorina saxatilis TaxID=31220 RepID=A0AAN9AVN9_9CAEN
MEEKYPKLKIKMETEIGVAEGSPQSYDHHYPLPPSAPSAPFLPEGAAEQSPFAALQKEMRLMRNEYANSFGRLFQLMEQQTQEIRELKEVQLQILQSSNPAAAAELNDTLPDGVSFPLGCSDDLANLEHQLGDQEVEQSVIQYLAVIGGNSLKEVTYNLLRGLFSQDLAEQYTWTGVGWKKAFHSLRLKHVLFKVVRLNKESKDATNVEIKKACQEWFRAAPDRNGGRRRRMERARAREMGEGLETFCHSEEEQFPGRYSGTPF